MRVQASYIPSPSTSVWHLGPLPVRAYALCIVGGILLAVWLTNRRFTARGAGPDDVWDVAKWAVPFGILGGRVYHVITDPELYFTHGTHPVDALKIWDGGLGIPGAIALGTLGAWIGCRRHGLRLSSFGDAGVPGVALAQALGRWGNYFNNELYGRPTTLPWKLQIHNWNIEAGHAVPGIDGSTFKGYFQPTFLYESLWDLALAGVLIYAGRRFALGNGRVFALYVMGYSLGRLWVEALRSDPANHILGLRVNTWTSMLGLLIGLAWFLTHREPRERSVYLDGRSADPQDASADETDADLQPPGVDDSTGDDPGDVAAEQSVGIAASTRPAKSTRAD